MIIDLSHLLTKFNKITVLFFIFDFLSFIIFNSKIKEQLHSLKEKKAFSYLTFSRTFSNYIHPIQNTIW